MFGFFKPKCPVDLEKKTWVEDAVLRLITLVGDEQLKRFEVITPESAKLPQDFRGTDECILNLCGWACRQMSVPKGRIEFHIIPGDDQFHLMAQQLGHVQTSDFNGLYYRPTEEEPKPQIYLRQGLHHDPQLLLAAITHEIAHDITQDRWPSLFDDPDLEPLTDLMPLLFGFGIYMANSVVRQRNFETGNGYAWTISRNGYLGIETFGYALAVLSYLRDEQQSDWSQHLTLDAQKTFWNGLKYLRSTDNRLVDQRLIAIRRLIKTPEDIREELATRLPSRQLKALWELQRHPEWTDDFIDQVLPFLHSSEVALRVGALYALRTATALRRDQYAEIIDGSFDSDPAIRIAVARAISPMAPDLELGLSVLMRMLRDNEPAVQTAALRSLHGLGDPLPAALERECLTCLQTSVSTHDSAMQQAAITLLKKIVFDIEESLRLSGLFSLIDIKTLLRSNDDDIQLD